MVLTMTAGTAVIMWLGELITDRGIGNGMSIWIFTQVVATFPPPCGRAAPWARWSFSIVIVIGIVIVAAVVFIEQAQRRIPCSTPPDGRPEDVRRLLDVHSAEGGPAGITRSSSPRACSTCRPWRSSSTRGPKPAGAGSHHSFLRGDLGLHAAPTSCRHLLHLLLRGDHVQPTEVAGNMKQYGGFIPGTGPGSRPRSTSLRPVPHHAAGRPLSDRALAGSVDRARVSQRATRTSPSVARRS